MVIVLGFVPRVSRSAVAVKNTRAFVVMMDFIV